MPAEGTEAIENLAFDLAREASELSGQLHPTVRLSVALLESSTPFEGLDRRGAASDMHSVRA